MRRPETTTTTHHTGKIDARFFFVICVLIIL